MVKVAIHKQTGQQYAVKIVHKHRFWHDDKSREQILREVEILRTVNHPNIISYKDIFDTDKNMYIVLEL